MKGSNLRIKVQLTLAEIAEGVTKKVKVFRLVQAEGVEYDTCRQCGGTGQVRRVTNTILGQKKSYGAPKDGEMHKQCETDKVEYW